jgi:hypothetical protein
LVRSLLGLLLPGLILGYVQPWKLVMTPSTRGTTATGPIASTRCWFKFDLRLLRTEIPDVVGDCVENEQTSDAGDTIQRTTGGLLVWRRHDRLTAFTDGSRTWAVGPNGLEVRRNDERFPWEASPPPAIPQAAAASPVAGVPPATATSAPPQQVIVSTPQPAAPAATSRAPVAPTPTNAPSKPAGQPGDAMKEIFDAAIVGSLRQSGLPLSGVQALTPENDPDKLLGKPGSYLSKIVFKDQRGAKTDGAIELFGDDAAMKSRQEKLEAIAKANPQLARYVYANGGTKMLMHVSKDLTPEQAKSYQQWLSTYKGG